MESIVETIRRMQVSYSAQEIRFVEAEMAKCQSIFDSLEPSDNLTRFKMGVSEMFRIMQLQQSLVEKLTRDCEELKSELKMAKKDSYNPSVLELSQQIENAISEGTVEKKTKKPKKPLTKKFKKPEESKYPDATEILDAIVVAPSPSSLPNPLDLEEGEIQDDVIDALVVSSINSPSKKDDESLSDTATVITTDTKKGRKKSVEIPIEDVIREFPNTHNDRQQYLSKLSMVVLKKLCKHFACKGHSKLTKKPDLVNFMIDNIAE